MIYPRVLLLLVSATLLAAKPLPPRSMMLYFWGHEGNYAKVRLKLKQLRQLARKGDRYGQQAQQIVHELRLISKVRDPLLMSELLSEIHYSEALLHEKPRHFSEKETRKVSYREQKNSWEQKQVDTHKAIASVYKDIGYQLTYKNKQLLQVLSPPLSPEDYRNQVLDRRRELWNIWFMRKKLDSLLLAYAVTDMRVEKLIDVILAKIATLDNAEAKKAQDKINNPPPGEAYSSWMSLSQAAYYRSVVAEMLRDANIEGQAVEVELQRLYSDLWAAVAEQRRLELAKENLELYRVNSEFYRANMSSTAN